MKIRAELHCHTLYSHDGLITFDGLRRIAEKRKIDAIAITDHDTIEGALEFQRDALKREASFRVIVGEEKTLEDGSHLIGLFLQKPLMSGHLRDAVLEIRDQGGLCMIPHPYRKKDGLLRDSSREDFSFLGIHGFEIFNAKCGQADNHRALQLLDAGPAPFGGSDAHYESDVGECITSVEWLGGLKETFSALVERRVGYSIHAVPQNPAGGERKYAPLYYRFKKYLRVPTPMLPIAKQAYRFYRNNIKCRRDPDLKEIFNYE